jgi:hypothetical protein
MRRGDKRNACRIILGNPEGNRSLGRLRRRWEDNIKMDLRETGMRGIDIFCRLLLDPEDGRS